MPDPGHYAVIFARQRSEGDDAAYGEMASRMVDLARTMPGFLGLDSAAGPDGFGITVSYWESEEAIARWKRHADHLVAQKFGREKWYTQYRITVARIERAYGGP